MSLEYEPLEQFEWDQANVDHIALHGVTPQEAEEVLNADTEEFDDRIVDGERRVAEVGLTRRGRFLVIAWVRRRDKLRVVTAFDASRAAKQMWFNRFVKGSR